jgi:hypothetical protein
MGYLDNSTVTVDAILTNKGRQILANGGQLNITKFALADDEVDYDLWNPSHTLGTNYYGKVIEDMPILEALPDETQMMRYKLVTLPKDVIGIPVISVTPDSIILRTATDSQVITPSTPNLPGGNSTAGYTAILSDDTVCSLEVAPGGAVSPTVQAADANVTSFVDDEVGTVTTAGQTITRVGKSFTVRAKSLTAPKNALITIIANETGGFKTISVTVNANVSTTVGVINPTSPSTQG